MHSLSQEMDYVISEIANRISKAIGPDATITMYIAGGVAMTYYCNTRSTDDIDAFYDKRLSLGGIDGLVSYKDTTGAQRSCYLDGNYNPTLGMMHEDFEKNAINWKPLHNKPANITIKVLSPIDLAITKIDRFSEQDRQDIMDLASAKLIDSSSLKTKSLEALRYAVGNTERIKNFIEIICKEIDAKTEAELASSQEPK